LLPTLNVTGVVELSKNTLQLFVDRGSVLVELTGLGIHQLGTSPARAPNLSAREPLVAPRAESNNKTMMNSNIPVHLHNHTTRGGNSTKEKADRPTLLFAGSTLSALIDDSEDLPTCRTE
jgi:hypothetical protein